MKSTKRFFCNWQWFMVLFVVLGLAGQAAAGSTWVQLTPTPDPVGGSSPRVAINTAVYNSATNRMILFGGRTDQMGYAMVNDVWVLTNADGTGGGPPAYKAQSSYPQRCTQSPGNVRRGL